MNFEEFRASLLSVALNVGHLSFASELLWLIYLWAINPGECCNHFTPVHARITRAYIHMLQDNKSSIFSVHNNLLSSYIFPFQNPPTSSGPRGGGGCGTPDFSLQGWSNGGKNPNPKSHAEFPRQKGVQATIVKAGRWTETTKNELTRWFTAGDTLQTIDLIGCIFNNYSLSPNGLWVNSPWGRWPNGLLTQRPWGREEQLF